MPRPRENLVGRVFGRLTVTADAGSRSGKTCWTCVCTCGAVKTYLSNALRQGGTLSCGCLIREKTSERSAVHGASGTGSYVCWHGMWQRCTNPKDKQYPRYKDRTPPESWRSYETFMQDMGPWPGKGYSIDRIKNDKPYGPGNCRWATMKEQQRNRDNTLRLTLDGVTKPLIEWAEGAGLKPDTVAARYRRGVRGEALLGPLQRIRK